VQSGYVALHVPPLVVGQHTPLREVGLSQKVVLAPQVPQRPDALPLLLSPLQ
jgi:hypothetical protein